MILDMTNSKLLKSLPYFAAIIAGVSFYLGAIFLNEIFHDLFINISATFFALPLLYFSYETAKNFSHKRLNKEIFNYAKMQIDSELLSLLNQLQKIVYTLEERQFSEEAINKFLSLTKKEVEKQLNRNEYLGFQIFKHWEVNEKGLHELLKNPFILEKMKDEQIISIINVVKGLRRLEDIQRKDSLYVETGKSANNYQRFKIT